MTGRSHRRRRRGRKTVWMLEPALLMLLHYGPAHGYTLLEQLKEFSLGDLNTSVVYRALRDMESKGWVLSTWDTKHTQGPPRRIYRLTELGDETLGQHILDLQETRGAINHFIGAYSQHMEEGEGEYH